MRRWNLVALALPLGVVGAALVATQARTWWDGLVLGAGLLAALVVLERWTADDFSRVATAGLAVTAAVWPYGALVGDSATAFYGLAVAGPLAVPRLSAHRRAAAAALTAYVAAAGAARLLRPHQDSVAVLVEYVLLPTSVVLVAIGFNFANHAFYRIMEQGRQQEAELAVYRERVRFAGDLHDIQGHTLHVVKLKVALAERLVRSDAARAERELREVRDLVGDTIARTRELAHAQRRLNLSVELENAKNLFEAAGIEVAVDRDGEAGHDLDERIGGLLGQVLRETTTNILRHSRATRVRLTLTATGIGIVNDGTPDGPRPALGGLAALRERIAAEGGELTADQRHGEFRTAAAFPRQPADRARRQEEAP
ncbi:sensor histidine kinase [Streptomyces lonarensis]|uniref:sensor histidine kinase n=1 Tax=Streptomyces lonarensis TaxID=700599 RepID=UPI0028A963F2|nr:histidine kinase [Streptomyces lonarensis]